eukprot:15344665-Ditylum_brightwellii.AAC.1
MSYCTELTGILATLYLLRALSSLASISITSKEEVYCNNVAVVVCSNRPLEPGITMHIAAEYDIKQEIWCIKNSGIDLDTWWVKAHQDDKIAVELLPLDARLNVQWGRISKLMVFTSPASYNNGSKIITTTPTLPLIS